MKDLPEGVEIDLNYFFTSDTAGVSVTVEMKGRGKLPDEADFAGALSPETRAKQLLPSFATDWRPMTPREIKDYKAEQEAERRAMREAGYEEDEQ